MFCPKCGNAMPDNARFCNSCGAPRPEPVQPEAATTPQPAYQPPSQVPYQPQSSPQQQYQTPPPSQPPRSRKGLWIAIIAACAVVVIVAAVVGGVLASRGDSGTETLAPAITTVPTTVNTTTTTTPFVDLRKRAAEWLNLLESIRGSGLDKTSKIASYLTPQDQAQSSAANYQKSWSSPVDADSVIVDVSWEKIVAVNGSEDAQRAVVVVSNRLTERNNVTCRGLECLSWTLVRGTWMRNIDFEPAVYGTGSTARIGKTITTSDVRWTPIYIEEQKHLSVNNDAPTTAGVFLFVGLNVINKGQQPFTPSSFSLTMVDENGKQYQISQAVDQWASVDAEDRATKLAAGESRTVWYPFEVPEGLDLNGLKFKIGIPVQ